MQFFSDESKLFLKEHLSKKNLSKREVEVVMLVIKGLTNREVANELCVAEKTVKFHLTNVYKKMNISRRSQIFWVLPLVDFININDRTTKNPNMVASPANSNSNNSSQTEHSENSEEGATIPFRQVYLQSKIVSSNSFQTAQRKFRRGNYYFVPAGISTVKDRIK